MDWLKTGYYVAPFVATVIVSIIITILGFRTFILPDLLGALEEAQTTITNLAKMAGVKSQEFKDAKGIEKLVAADLIKERLPELEALKLILSPGTWEQIEATIEENPEAVIQLYQKYGHLLNGPEGATRNSEYMF